MNRAILITGAKYMHFLSTCIKNAVSFPVADFTRTKRYSLTLPDRRSEVKRSAVGICCHPRECNLRSVKKPQLLYRITFLSCIVLALFAFTWFNESFDECGQFRGEWSILAGPKSFANKENSGSLMKRH